MNSMDHILPVSTALSSVDAMMAILMILATCVWFKGKFVMNIILRVLTDELNGLYGVDNNMYSIRNRVEKVLCAIGCIGVVILALAWAFYVAKRCKYPHRFYTRLSLTQSPWRGNYSM